VLALSGRYFALSAFRLYTFSRETMTEPDYAQLQARYGGQFVAHRQGQVLAHAQTYEELEHQLEVLDLQDQEIIIEYIERPDCAYVY